MQLALKKVQKLGRLILFRLLPLIGINLHHSYLFITKLPRFLMEAYRYKEKNKTGSFALKLNALSPILQDYDDSAGHIKNVYFIQDLWASQKIYQANPARHIDIGSRIDGFIGNLLSFRDVDVIDIRPLTSEIDGLHFIQADATNLEGFEDNSLESISSLHVAEHFGLGRYGDPIDPEGHIKFINSLKRVLAKDGRLYFSVPSGPERLIFNAHRVFHPQTILNLFSDLDLIELSYIDKESNLIKNVQIEDIGIDRIECALFEFTKR